MQSSENFNKIKLDHQISNSDDTINKFESLVEKIKFHLKEITSDEVLSLSIIANFHHITYDIQKHIFKRSSFIKACNYNYIKLVGENESEIAISWDSSAPMKTLLQLLNQIQELLDLEDEEQAFQNHIKEKYGLELNYDSLFFWETIYDL